jgi:DHA1 family tetracycline resistance protein-like MFS transporter
MAPDDRPDGEPYCASSNSKNSCPAYTSHGYHCVFSVSEFCRLYSHHSHITICSWAICTRRRHSVFISIILAIYAFCSFLAAPFLGVLSDRLGRRPVLILSLLGSALGFLIFGLGGALWVLVLGRVVEGLTAGSIATFYACVADMHAPHERGAAFGLLGAAGGLGFMCGPALGGILGQISLSAPLYCSAALATVNALWMFLAVPESHTLEHRLTRVGWKQLNPILALMTVCHHHRLRVLFRLAFIFCSAAVLMQSNLSIFLKDLLDFDVITIGWVLFGVGLTDIVCLGFLAPLLLTRLVEEQVAFAGFIINATGFLTLAVCAFFPSVKLFAIGITVLTTGDGLVQPSLNTMISKKSPDGQQGMVQGANQSQQSVARVIAPLASAALYSGSAALLSFSFRRSRRLRC